MKRTHPSPHNGNTCAQPASRKTGASRNPYSSGNTDQSPGMPSVPTPLPSLQDLQVSAGRIRYFADLDLGELVNVPTKREDVVALSVRMDAAFGSLMDSAVSYVAEDPKTISCEMLKAVVRELALGFIGRYGALAFYSSAVVEALWSAQQRELRSGPAFMKEVGQRLAVFVEAQSGHSPQMNIDIAFTFNKHNFLSELEQLSRDLDHSSADESKTDLFLSFVRTGRYEMLGRNLRLLEEFFACEEINPHLHAKNGCAAERLSRYGARGLSSDEGESITPDWFFYTWIGWITNKSPHTVRRLIQTAGVRFRSQIAGYEKSARRNP